MTKPTDPLTDGPPCPGCRDIRAYQFDMASFFDEKAAWSRATFGSGHRRGVIEHIRSELAEIEAKPSDLTEWIDVVLLAMDGAARSAGSDGAAFVAALIEKQRRNERRTWPSDVPPDAATHHVEE
jgi:hypothetical protein